MWVDGVCGRYRVPGQGLDRRWDIKSEDLGPHAAVDTQALIARSA